MQNSAHFQTYHIQPRTPSAHGGHVREVCLAGPKASWFLAGHIMYAQGGALGRFSHADIQIIIGRVGPADELSRFVCLLTRFLHSGIDAIRIAAGHHNKRRFTFGVVKTCAYIIFLLPSLAIAQAEKDSLSVVPLAVTLTDTVGTPSLPDRVLELAKSFIGTPYKYGSNSTNQFDCSGFVRHCYGSCRIELPHGSGSQAQLCDAVELSEVQPGDLLFFKGRNAKSSHIGHVAMVLDTSDGKIRMIHATTHGGVMVDVYNDSAYYTTRFVKAGRLKPHIVAGLNTRPE